MILRTPAAIAAAPAVTAPPLTNLKHRPELRD